jgi:hypothetical protein
MRGPDFGEDMSSVEFNNTSGDGDDVKRGCTNSDTTSLPRVVDGPVTTTNDVRAEILSLVSVVIPHEIDNVDDLLFHFDGREEKLRDTLRGMYERKIRIGSMDVTQARRDTQTEEAKTSSLATISEIGDNIDVRVNFDVGSVYVECDPNNLSGGSSINETEYDPKTLSVGSSINETDEEIGLTEGNICLVPLASVQDVDAEKVAYVSEKKSEILDPTLPMPWWKKRRKLMFSCVVLIALLVISGVFLVVLLHGNSPTNDDNERSIAAPTPVSLEITSPSSMPSTPPISTLMSTNPYTAATTTVTVVITTPSPMQSTPPALTLISTKPSTAATTANEATPVAASTTTPTLFPTRFSTPNTTANISANDANPSSIPTTSPSASCYPVEITILYDAFPFGTGYVIAEAAAVSTSFSFFPSDDSLAYQYHRQSLCFEKGIYTFTIYDKKGDGLCCANGIGEYVVSSNGVTLTQGGEFLMKEEKPFELPA